MGVTLERVYKFVNHSGKSLKIVASQIKNRLFKNSEVKKATIDQELNQEIMKTHYLFSPLFIVLILWIGFIGCRDNSGPELEKGHIKIITITQGENVEGYDVRILGEQQTHIAANDTLISENLNDGTYKVELLELPEKCSVIGVNPATIEIEDAQEATITFEVNCEETQMTTGSFKVVTNTSPANSGYSFALLINGTDEYDIAANDTLVFNNQEYGSYMIKLNEIPENCTVEGENPQFAQIENEEKVTINFDVTCNISGSLEVITNTSVINSQEIYSFNFNNQQFEIGANDTLLIGNIEPGNYQLDLSGIPSTCIVYNNPREVSINTQTTESRVFKLFCQTVFGYKLVYPSVSNVEGHSIYILYPDGNRETISPRFRSASTVQVSPSLTDLAFKGTNPDHWNWGYELYVTDTNGNGLVQLTHQPDEPAVGGVSWSPNGEKLVFNGSLNDLRTTSNIYIIDADGSDLTQITDNEGVNNHSPLWTNDGTKIIFLRKKDSQYDIYSMNTDGSDLKNITKTPNISEIVISWAPDGSKIQYVVYEEDMYIYYTIDPDGSNKKLILKSGNDRYGFSWSPDGSKIAYSQIFYGSDENVPAEVDSGTDIYVMNADGSNPVQLTHTEKIGFTNRVESWSPDGKYIVFSQYPWYTDAISIFTMNADGTEINRISSDACCFKWLPLD